jgi:hypothetical protein
MSGLAMVGHMSQLSGVPRLITATLITGAALVAITGCSSASSENLFVGSWGETGDLEPSLTIEADGSFHGTDGCNRLTGEGEISGDVLNFGDFASTAKACIDVDTWLSQAATAKVDGSALVIYEENGDRLGALPKQ